MNTKRLGEMDLATGLTSQFKDIVEVCNVVVYGSRIGLTGVAAHLLTTDSTLSKMLNKQRDKANKRQLPALWINGIVEATGDARPIQFILEQYYEDAHTKRNRALDRIPTLVSELEEALRQVKR